MTGDCCSRERFLWVCRRNSYIILNIFISYDYSYDLRASFVYERTSHRQNVSIPILTSGFFSWRIVGGRMRTRKTYIFSSAKNCQDTDVAVSLPRSATCPVTVITTFAICFLVFFFLILARQWRRQSARERRFVCGIHFVVFDMYRVVVYSCRKRRTVRKRERGVPPSHYYVLPRVHRIILASSSVREGYASNYRKRAGLCTRAKPSHAKS